jgi:hypothetical protein
LLEAIMTFIRWIRDENNRLAATWIAGDEQRIQRMVVPTMLWGRGAGKAHRSQRGRLSKVA